MGCSLIPSIWGAACTWKELEKLLYQHLIFIPQLINHCWSKLLALNCWWSGDNVVDYLRASFWSEDSSRRMLVCWMHLTIWRPRKDQDDFWNCGWLGQGGVNHGGNGRTTSYIVADYYFTQQWNHQERQIDDEECCCEVRRDLCTCGDAEILEDAIRAWQWKSKSPFSRTWKLCPFTSCSWPPSF